MVYQKHCPICNNKLEIDDIDEDFEGKQNEYSVCNHCHLDFVFYIRYGNLWKYTKTKMYFDKELNEWVCGNDKKDTEEVIVYKKWR